MKKAKVSPLMVELLNCKLKEEGSSLQYVLEKAELYVESYKLTYVDKFIDTNVTTNIAITKEFENYVRDFFAKYGVTDTGYSNTVHNLLAWRDCTEI